MRLIHVVENGRLTLHILVWSALQKICETFMAQLYHTTVDVTVHEQIKWIYRALCVVVQGQEQATQNS